MAKHMAMHMSKTVKKPRILKAGHVSSKGKARMRSTTKKPRRAHKLY